MENHIDHPLTVTVEQAAKLLGIGRSTAYELVHTGAIPSLRLGRRLVVPVAQIAEQLSAPSEAVWATLAREASESGRTSTPGPASSGTTRSTQGAAEAPTLF